MKVDKKGDRIEIHTSTDIDVAEKKLGKVGLKQGLCHLAIVKTRQSCGPCKFQWLHL